jgi:RNA polymerase sigma-70 factor, ECF subfamily
MPNTDQEPDLIAKAIGGDTVALEHLLLNHYPRLEAHVTPKIPPRARRQLTAEDIMQDVFSQAFQDISNYEARDGASFFAWLRAIADHRLADALRRLGRKKRGGDHQQLSQAALAQTSSVMDLIDAVCHESHAPDKSVARHDAAHAIHVCVASLPDDQQRVIRERFFEGKSVEEIATDMDRTAGAVRGLIYRAQKNLAEAMGRASQWLSSR